MANLQLLSKKPIFLAAVGAAFVEIICRLWQTSWHTALTTPAHTGLEACLPNGGNKTWVISILCNIWIETIKTQKKNLVLPAKFVLTVRNLLTKEVILPRKATSQATAAGGIEMLSSSSQPWVESFVHRELQRIGRSCRVSFSITFGKKHPLDQCCSVCQRLLRSSHSRPKSGEHEELGSYQLLIQRKS